MSNIYNFAHYDDIKFIQFSLENIDKIIGGLLGTFGYYGGVVSAKDVLCNSVCAVIIVILFVQSMHILKKQNNAAFEKKLLIIFFLFGVLVLFTIYTLTNMDFTARYVLPISFFVIPIIAMFLKSASHTYLKYIVTPIVIITFIVSGAFWNNTAYNFDFVGDDLRCVAGFLNNRDYDKGFSTFTNANMLTMLTNGKLDVCSWGLFYNPIDAPDISPTAIDAIDRPDYQAQWLQKVDTGISPDENVFIVMERKNWDNWPIAKNISDDKLVYETDTLVVYDFDSYSEMQQAFQK